MNRTKQFARQLDQDAPRGRMPLRPMSQTPRAPAGSGFILVAIPAAGFWVALAAVALRRPDFVLWAAAGGSAIASIVGTIRQAMNSTDC